VPIGGRIRRDLSAPAILALSWTAFEGRVRDMRGLGSKSRRLLTTAALAGMATGGAFAGAVQTSAATAEATVTLAHQVVSGLSSDTDLGAVDPNQQIEVAVTLRKDLAALQKAEGALYDPTSASYHHF